VFGTAHANAQPFSPVISLLCGPLYVRARTISILQANPLWEVTTRWIAHLESNLRPCIKSILIPPRGYCPAPSSTNTLLPVYDVYHTRQPLKNSQHSLTCPILRNFFVPIIPLGMYAHVDAQKFRVPTITTSSLPPRARQNPLALSPFNLPLYSSQSSPSRTLRPSLFQQVV